MMKMFKSKGTKGKGAVVVKMRYEAMKVLKKKSHSKKVTSKKGGLFMPKKYGKR